MKNLSSSAGFSLLDLMTALLLTGVIGAIALPAGHSTIRRHQLNSTVQTLNSDLRRVRLKALESNSNVTLRIESETSYDAAGSLKRLPQDVHFSDASADSVVFDRLGMVADGLEYRLRLVGPDGAVRELLITPSGAVEVRKP